MKQFFTIITIFIILIALIIINNIYINNIASELAEKAVSLPPADDPLCAEKTDELHKLWSDNVKKISFSVPLYVLNDFTDMITSMYLYAEHGDSEKFENERRLFLGAMNRITRLEKIF